MTGRLCGDLKSQADHAFRNGSYAEAYELYASVEKSLPGPDVTLLLNKSIAALRMGETATSLEDAKAAQALLRDGGLLSPEGEGQLRGRQAKACYREGCALADLGRHGEALEAYRRGLVAKPGEPGLRSALRKSSHHMKVDWLAQTLAEQIRDAQAPNRFSSRDGKLLKPPIDKYQLHPKELRIKAREVLLGREQEFRDYVCGSWERGKQCVGRCVLSAVRALCYLSKARADEEGAVEQSLRDSRAAVAFAPEAGQAGPGSRVPSAARGRALATHAAVLEHLGDYVGAAIEIFGARELCPDSDEFGDDLARLKAKLTEEQRAAAEAGGSRGLREWREDERERSLPEHMRKRPKYYYYYEWMRKRIHGALGDLPGPVVDKLLTTDADELDLLLQYPQAIKGQAEEYLGVLRDRGERALETYSAPRMAWDEVRALEAGAGGAEEGNLLLTSHAMVGGGGDGGLTAAERIGAPVRPQLDPEAARRKAEAEGWMDGRKGGGGLVDFGRERVARGVGFGGFELGGGGKKKAGGGDDDLDGVD